MTILETDIISESRDTHGSGASFPSALPLIVADLGIEVDCLERVGGVN
jgi:hypothetical protein